MKIENENPEVNQPSEIELLQQQLFLASQRKMAEISNEIAAIEEKHKVSIGVQLDATKMADIFRYMLQNNKPMVSLKFEIWQTP